MTFRVTMTVRNFLPLWPSSGKTREVTTQFAGCVDQADAESKARQVYDVVKFKKVEPVKDKKEGAK